MFASQSEKYGAINLLLEVDLLVSYLQWTSRIPWSDSALFFFFSEWFDPEHWLSALSGAGGGQTVRVHFPPGPSRLHRPKMDHHQYTDAPAAVNPHTGGPSSRAGCVDEQKRFERDFSIVLTNPQQTLGLFFFFTCIGDNESINSQ